MNTERPWMTAIEMQFATLRLQRTFSAIPGLQPSVTDPVVTAWLPKATPFAWSADTCSAVWLASKTVPMDARWSMDLLPDGLAACWWWFAQPLPIGMEESSDDRSDLDTEHLSGILLGRNPSGLWICDCRMSDYGPMCTGLTAASEGATLSEIEHGRCIDAATGHTKKHARRSLELIRFVMAAGVWLNQRIAVITDGHIERHRRKQLAREYAVDVSNVRVVELRRTESAPRLGCNVDPIEWSCRWIVNGHWRNQYHPSSGKHELKYILPYVKGPEDKPLKIPSQTVYSVNR